MLALLGGGDAPLGAFGPTLLARRSASLAAARARGRVFGGWHCTRQFRTTPAFPRVKHESAAVDESRLRAIGIMRTALACTKSQSEARQASVGKTLAPVFPTRSRLAAPRVVRRALLKAAKDQPCTKCQGRTKLPKTAQQGLPRRTPPTRRQQWAMPPLYQKGSTRTRPAP